MNAQAGREAVITGIGLVTSLGEGTDAHWAALNAEGGAKAVVDRTRFAPYPVHPAPALDFDGQIPKRGDQRQMELLQRLGTYAAGLALTEAGLAGNEDMLARADMTVAVGGGERDIALDGAILSELSGADADGPGLNERLMNGLRPTLFLAQLPNLLAGNISIVHKVTGSSRTFMGEESAGIDAVRTARARIVSGQSEVCLVGGAYNAERPDMLLVFELGAAAWREEHRDVWSRAPHGGGIVTGSMAAFLVIESSGHAAARGARAIAALGPVFSDRCRRAPDEAAATAGRQFAALRPDLAPGALAVLSGATGAEPATSQERSFLTDLGGGDIDISVRALGSAIGHGVEAQFPALVAMAAMAVDRGTLFPPLEASGFEAAAPGRVRQVLVTCWGHWRGEGMALVRAPA